MTIQETKRLIETFRTECNADTVTVENIRREKDEIELSIAGLKKQIETYDVEKLLLQKAGQKARAAAAEIMESIASHGLQSVMGSRSLKIKLNENGNNPSIDFRMSCEYNGYVADDIDIENLDSGGAADLVALSVFFALNKLAGKHNSACLLLDEPTKFVSPAHSEAAARFIREISHYLGKQVFMSTHDTSLKCVGDKDFRMELDSQGRSKIIQE